MTLNRRQALALAALGLLETRQASAQSAPSDETRYFDTSPSALGGPAWARWDLWPQVTIQGVICTISWGLPPDAAPKKAGTYDLRYRGLKQGYGQGKDLLKTEWSALWVYQGKRLFGRKGLGADSVIYEIPVSKKGKNIQVGKPTATPYLGIHLSKGIRYGYADVQRHTVTETVPGGTTAEIGYETSAVTFLDEDLAPLLTLKGLLGTGGFSPIYGYGRNYRIETSDPQGVRVTAIIDSTGQLLSPLIPVSETQMFVTASARASGGFTEHYLLGVATDSERKRFYPLSADGHLPADPLPFRGYIPAPALPPTGPGRIGPTQQFYVTHSGWLKEYALPEGTAYGWASFDLTTETGPVWRGISWHPRYVTSMVGELLTGGFMVYRANPSSDILAPGWRAHLPMLPTPAATYDEALRLYEPIYQEQVVKPQQEALKRQQEAATRYWDERRRDNLALLAAHGYRAGTGKESAAQLQEIADTIRSIQLAVYEKKVLDYYKALDKLPYDWRVRYLLHAPRTWGSQERFDLNAQQAEAYAKSVTDPELVRLLKDRAEILKAQEAAQKKADEEAKKRAAADAKQLRRIYTAPSSAGWLYGGSSSFPLQPVNTIRAEATSQYMKDLGSYIHGNSIWKPTLRY